MDYREIRQAVIDASLKSQRLGLIRSTSGNISLRGADGVIAVTPSGIPYDALEPGDIPLVDADGTVIDAPHRPSSELLMHLAILKARSDINAVVHTHSKYCTVLTLIGQELPAVTLPVLSYGTHPAPTVPFEMPGSPELGEAAARAIGKEGFAVLLEYHGMVCAGGTLEEAMTCAEYIDEAAEIAVLSRMCGSTGAIPEDKAAAVARLFSKHTADK